MLELVIVLVLIACNAFFALSEMSVVTSRKPRLKQMAADSQRARKALELAEHPERFLSTVQVGITLIGILTGMFGGDAIGAERIHRHREYHCGIETARQADPDTIKAVLAAVVARAQHHGAPRESIAAFIALHRP